MKTLTGGPDLRLFEGPDALSGRNWFRLETVWINEGGAGQGLLVTVSGAALENARVRAEHVLLGPPASPTQRGVALVPGMAGDQRVVFADLPEWEICPGVEIPPGPASCEELAALGAAMIPVVLTLEVLAAGPTQLHLEVSARDAGDADRLTVDLDLT